MSLILIKDGITPDLRRRARAAADGRPLLQAMGEAARDLARDAFSNASSRPTSWARRKDPDKKHPLLYLRGELRRGLRVISITNTRVIIGSHTASAAAHQFGTKDIPARPFLPFYASGQMTALGNHKVETALRSALRVRGL